MSLIDFSQFVNELANLSGQAILPFFRTAIAPENKGGASSIRSPRPTGPPRP
jgi:myo-inositol-1(or 4)-monophosphatase